MRKKYVVPEKSFLRQVGRGFWVGSTFLDHGQMMRIVGAGRPYGQGREALIDIEAEQIPRTDRPAGKSKKLDRDDNLK